MKQSFSECAPVKVVITSMPTTNYRKHVLQVSRCSAGRVIPSAAEPIGHLHRLRLWLSLSHLNGFIDPIYPPPTPTTANAPATPSLSPPRQ